MAMMRTEIEVIGLTHKSGKDVSGKPYDYYKVHIAYDDKWTTGRTVASISCSTKQVEQKQLIVGMIYDAIVSVDKGRVSAYIV